MRSGDENSQLYSNTCSGQSNNNDLSCAKCTAFSSTQFKEEMINRYYTPEQAKIRQDIYDLVKDNPLFERKYGLSKEQERQLTHDRAVYIIQKLRPFELEHFRTDPKRFFTFLDTVNNIDFGVAGRSMIHFGLFGGSVLYFGTEKHKQFQDRIVNDFGKIFGMFCMSEIGHASNVQQIETLAIYDHQSKTINIRTPSDSAVKVWSGGAAQFAQWAVVFAQLVVDKKCGVHAFLVPIRSEKDHSVLPGIRIRDLGSKIGLNCLDNGRVWFDVKISKDLMLDRFGTIDENGQYKTSIPDESVRFLAHVQALLIGRIMTASSSLNALKMALEITLKYAVHRRQFGPTNSGEELQIINYLSYQRRLYPYLAFSFVAHFSVEDLKRKYETNSDSKMIHTLASCLKAKCSDISLLGCQECRKSSGAQGFLSANRIGEMRDIADASITYEGDNNVLYQTASRNLVRR
ncbi:acyl-CoA oxidase-like protein, partial [Naegleria gruberi]